MPRSVFTDAYAALTEALIEARQVRSLTQDELADLLGRHQSYVSKVERGERRIDLVEFVELAHALGIAPTALFAAVLERRPEAFAAKFIAPSPGRGGL